MQAFKKIIVALLTLEARLVLRRYRPMVIAVTGSVGKTSTKDAIFTVLADGTHVRKSQKSFNSELGVPLTILGRENAWHDPLKWIANIVDGFLLVILKTAYPSTLVLEVGADRPGDIRTLGRWLRPKIAVITAIPEIPVHVEYFPDVDAVAAEKRSLAEALVPGGVLVVNGDDPRTRDIPKPDGTVITYGFSEGCTVQGGLEEVLYDEQGAPRGMSMRISYGGGSETVELVATLGRTQMYPILAASAVAYALTIDPGATARKLSAHITPPGRMKIIPGAHGVTLIDDTYNASPAAVSGALTALQSIKARRKIFVIADMMELGKYSADAHRQIGQEAAQAADIIVAVGMRARGIAEAARVAGKDLAQVISFEKEQRDDAIKLLLSVVKVGDVVLVKGSQSMRMETIVKALMAEPSRAKDMLVRQESEWLAKE